MARKYSYISGTGLVKTIEGQHRRVYDALCHELESKNKSAPEPKMFMFNGGVNGLVGQQLLDFVRKFYRVELSEIQLTEPVIETVKLLQQQEEVKKARPTLPLKGTASVIKKSE